jgi:hypothetical protein
MLESYPLENHIPLAIPGNDESSHSEDCGDDAETITC